MAAQNAMFTLIRTTTTVARPVHGNAENGRFGENPVSRRNSAGQAGHVQGPNHARIVITIPSSAH